MLRTYVLATAIVLGGVFGLGEQAAYGRQT